MPDVTDTLKQELNSLIISVDMLDKNTKLTERKKNAIAQEISRIQLAYYSFRAIIDISQGAMEKMDDYIETLMTTRDSIETIDNPSILKTLLDLAVKGFSTEFNYADRYGYKRSSITDFYTSNPDQIKVTEIQTLFKRLVKEISKTNRMLNILFINPFSEFTVGPLMHSQELENAKCYLNMTEPDSYIRSKFDDLHLFEDIAETPVQKLKVTAKAMDVVFYRPLIYDICEKSYKKTSDRKTIGIDKLITQLRRSMKLVRIHGLYVTILPSYLLDRQNLKAVHTMLEDVHIQVLSKSVGSLILWGIRKDKSSPMDTDSVKENSTYLYNLIRKENGLTDVESIPLFKRNHTLPSNFIPIAMFHGECISHKIVDNLKQQSTLSKDILRSVSTIETKESRPLLPFTKGQLGMILTSGVLNGVIKESGDGYAHVIKGTVIKEETVTTEKDKTKNEEIQKTVLRNKVKLSLCTPEGNIITLS